jgi:short-subunit dehydrogenase
VVNVLVNNAAQGVYGPFIETDIQKQLQIIQLNVVSLTALTYLFLRDMVARNEGKILQVGSVLSELPGTLQSVYGGTKAYILSFTEALISEVKDTDVTLTFFNLALQIQISLIKRCPKFKIGGG